MSLVKYRPLENLLSLERTFDNLLKSSDWFSKESWMPETDVVETDNEVKVQLECPGISPENIKVKYENNMLTISGEKKNEHEEKNGNYHRLERSYGSFTRSFKLPSVEQESIAAEYKDGVISIIAKKSEDSKARNIEIKTNEESKPKALSATASG